MRSTTAPVPSPPSPAACNWREAGFAVYVHWPFCQAKCPYCDFNSHVSGCIDQSPWRDAMVREIGRAAELTPGREVTSVFFGGGTPSLMEPETVGAVLDAVRRGWHVPAAAEITLEANPTSVEAGRFRGYRAAGVNRASLGVQALDDVDLRRLGRMHSAAEALAALDLALDVFPRVSADLIYARQEQTPEGWRRELREALSLGLDHLSLYQLTIEPETVFGERQRRGLLRGVPDEDAAADLYDMTQELCGAVGMPAYEVSNHARVGQESRHNLVYWRAGDWVGIGPGAVGRITQADGRWASVAPLTPGAWLEAARGPDGAAAWAGVEDEGAEYVMMGLRLSEGISVERARRLGADPTGAALAEFLAAGLVELEGDRLRTTERGRPLLNAILRKLL